MKEGQVYQQRALPAHDQSPEIAKPGKGAFDLPAASVTSQLAPVLGGRLLAVLAMWHHQLNRAPAARATDRCRSRDRRSGVPAFGADDPDRRAGRQSWSGWVRATSLPPGTPRPGGLPEEHLGRRPAAQPSTLCLSPAWFPWHRPPGQVCRRRRPLFGWGETAVGKGFTPIQLFPLVQRAQKRAPNR